jgi:hypothetical protein
LVLLVPKARLVPKEIKVTRVILERLVLPVLLERKVHRVKKVLPETREILV